MDENADELSHSGGDAVRETEAGRELVLSSPICTMVRMLFPLSGPEIVVLRRQANEHE